MSLREKAAWICLATTAAVYLPYFIHVYRLIHDGAFQTDKVFNMALDAIMLQTLLAVFALVLLAFRQRKEPKDERDAAIEAKSFRYAYGTLACASFILVMAIPLFTISHLASHADRGFIPLLASQALLLCFVVAEMVKYVTQAVGYRRGI